MESGMDKDGRPLNEAVAKQIINRIRRDRGDIDETDEIELQKTDPAWQDGYRRREREWRRMLADRTKDTAEGMYLSRSRFIMELLQNADDADHASTVIPCLTFRLRSDVLIVDSNERGFTEDNVVSICSTGDSSKKGDSQTTGEKGYGFKSVFGIANMVHIQSDKWSFRFEHHRGGDGLGMVTPHWTEPSSELFPPEVTTRFRLSLIDTDPEGLSGLMKEFDDLPDTVVFALRRLTKIEIIYENVLGRHQQRTIEREGKHSDGEILITKHIQSLGVEKTAETKTKTKIRTISHKADDLPVNALQDQDRSLIILGFQVDTDTGFPVIPDRGQHAFAFLPVQRLSQLPVLVHADFVLSPNREGILADKRNDALRKGIVKCFVLAVKIFTKIGDPLLYKWVRFMPTRSAELFWDGFHEDIQAELSKHLVLRTRIGIMRDPGSVRILPSRMLFDHKPILPDLVFDPVYLAPEYEHRDVQKLEVLGVRTLDSEQILARLQRDLQSSDAQIYKKSLDNDWHTALTNLLGYLIDEKHGEKISKLKIIPLTTSKWVQPELASGDPIYLPRAVDEPQFKVDIPDNLGLQRLHPTSCAVAERLSFYKRLGVSHCREKTLLQKILHAQADETEGPVDDYVAQFQLLFWFGQHFHGSSFSLRAYSEAGLVVASTRLFLRTNTEYEALDLLGGDPTSIPPDYGFLHESYTSVPAESIPMRHGQTWASWLAECAGIRSYPSLLDGSNQLHPILQLTAMADSAKFLGCLHKYWESSYRLEGVSCIETNLKNQLVTCMNGTTRLLHTTILPTATSMQRSGTLGLESALPFLKLPEEVDLNGEDSWRFLQRFGVTNEVNLSYHFQELTAVKDQFRKGGKGSENWCFATCGDIYGNIARIATLGQSIMLRAKFKEMNCIFIPGRSPSWCGPGECLWTGPSFITLSPVLRDIYRDFPGAEQLFVKLLGVPDASHVHVLLEIRQVQETGRPSETLLFSHYNSLSEMCKDPVTKDMIKDHFLGYPYIYADTKWLLPSESIWQSTVHLSGRTAIGNLYPNLEDFFRECIGVVTQDAAMILREIMSLAQLMQAKDKNGIEVQDQLKTIDRIKELMVVTGQVIQVTKRDEDVGLCLKRLKHYCFLPCRLKESKSLERPGASFFVVDNKRYGAAFADSLRFLDFDDAEMTFVYPLLDALNLLGTSLSQHVTVEIDVHDIVDEGSTNGVLSSYLQQRAYAISCCATSHHSPKYFNKSNETHELLMGAKVISCEKMTTSLQVRSNGEYIVVQSDRPLLKIVESDKDIKIFVPSKEEDLYACFRTELPLQLTKTLQIEDRKAIKQLYRIINDESMSLEAIMVEEDITAVTWLEQPPSIESAMVSIAVEQRHGVSVDQSLPGGVMTPRSNQDDPVEIRVLEAHSPSRGSETDPGSQPSTPLRTLTPQSRLSPSPGFGSTLQNVAHDRLYRRLLERVIGQARGSAQDSFSMSALSNALEDDDAGIRRVLGLGSGRRLEKAKIGAAGELYVFERLRTLGLEGFSRENWLSTIRDRVNVVPEYNDLEARTGPEEADLMYEARTDDLERFLRQHSKLAPFPGWERFQPQFNRPVKYLIEVKATTEERCSSAFYMSDAQYERLKGEQGIFSTRPHVVYLICRVYNLLGKIGLEIFVDPWRLKDTVLKFDPYKYRVTFRPRRVSAGTQGEH